ncbi:MAG: hypothetical protein QXI37_02345, partial [Thermoprotei archaeon]
QVTMFSGRVFFQKSGYLRDSGYTHAHLIFEPFRYVGVFTEPQARLMKGCDKPPPFNLRLKPKHSTRKAAVILSGLESEYGKTETATTQS